MATAILGRNFALELCKQFGEDDGKVRTIVISTDSRKNFTVAFTGSTAAPEVARDANSLVTSTYELDDPDNTWAKKLCDIMGIDSGMLSKIEITLQYDDAVKIRMDGFATKQMMEVPLPPSKQ